MAQKNTVTLIITNTITRAITTIIVTENSGVVRENQNDLRSRYVMALHHPCLQPPFGDRCHSSLGFRPVRSLPPKLRLTDLAPVRAVRLHPANPASQSASGCFVRAP